MDKFDRKTQYDFLMSLYHSHPHGMSMETYCKFKDLFGEDGNEVANIIYLAGHGLIEGNYKEIRLGLFDVTPEHLKITPKGIDFVRDDGGLSSILNVQVIKFHKEAVVIMEDLIAISSMQEDEKEKAKSKLAELSAEALKAVVSTAVTAGLAVLSK